MLNELWKIDKSILDCMDLETGEILDEEKIASLQMEKVQVIENLGLLWKSTKADAAAIDSEIDRLKAIKDNKKKLIVQIENWINDATGGESYKSVSGLWESKITKSKATEVIDMDALLRFDTTGRFIRFGKPEANKAEIKKAITKEGITVPGCAVVEKLNFSMK